MNNQDIYRLPGQQVQKSIIYEIPRNQQSMAKRYYEPQESTQYRKYKLKEEVQGPRTGNEVLCLNCNQYVRMEQVDSHSLGHVKVRTS